MRRKQHQLPVAIAACSLLASCAHQTLIATEPPGAELYVDGTQVGITPFTLEDTVGAGNRYEIVLRKPGYEIIQATLQQDQFSWPKGIASIGCGTCTLGLGCLGLLWSWQLEDRYAFTLRSTKQKAPESAPSSLPGADPGSTPSPEPAAESIVTPIAAPPT